MLYGTVLFVAAVVGFTGIAAGGASIANTVFFAFTVLASVSLLFGGRSPTRAHAHGPQVTRMGLSHSSRGRQAQARYSFDPSRGTRGSNHAEGKHLSASG